MRTLDLSSGEGERKRIKIDSFLRKYMKGGVLGLNLFRSLNIAPLNGYDYALVDASLIKELDRKLAAYKKAELMLHETARLNNMGIEAEKDGRIFDALEVYERNIALGGRALHAYDRLRILYHKAKDYENEIRVIRRMVEVYEIDPSDESIWWVKQLRKAEMLLDKAARKNEKIKSSTATAVEPVDEPINIFWTE